MAHLETIRPFSIIYLGELCRWIFLFNTMVSEGFWLKSKYLYVWIIGSTIVAFYMPIVSGASCDEVKQVSLGFCCRRAL